MPEFASAFTFQYSIRPGTPAATMDDQVPKPVVQERYERLTALQERISWEENQKLVGRTVEVLVSSGDGRRTPRRIDSAAAPKTAASCTSRSPPVPSCPGRAMSSRSRSRTPHHSTCWPTRSTTRRWSSVALARATRGIVPRPRAVRYRPSAGHPLQVAVSLGLPTLRARTAEPLVAPGVGTMPIYDPTDAQR